MCMRRPDIQLIYSPGVCLMRIHLPAESRIWLTSAAIVLLLLLSRSTNLVAAAYENLGVINLIRGMNYDSSTSLAEATAMLK